ncbi:hypothetical protein J2W32_004461 [Variovorax boronicumulans]|uniref:Minor tail protein n=1 Tax=Variovorax boronicumulans TaxID=436515 RepID=A0AAW8CVB1_9BURK|nr:hypothetical protein [Variovorax boronicumulans]MDP9895363.1 hypothetical protein [Variovorax boronicumulans]MDQ0055403.1 hypothetical protein [Variovorax boronicumulans]
MALVVADRVYETSTTTGPGSYTLAGAITGYRAFSSVCANGDTVECFIESVDANGVPNGGWEAGIYTWGTGGVLARTRVTASSNGNAAVNWSAGTRRVGVGLIASRLASIAPPPNIAVADYAWVNQGAATVTEVENRVTVVSSGVTGDSWNILKKAAAIAAGNTVKLTAYGLFRGSGAPPSNQGLGLVLRESSTGKFVVLQWQPNAASAGGAFVWTNPTTFGSTVVSFPIYSPKTSPVAFAVRYTGTQWNFSWTLDGAIWHDAGAFTIASFAPDEIGIGVNSQGTGAFAVVYASRLEVF